MSDKSLDRICIFDPANGSISIRLISDLELVIGLDFKIYTPDGKTSLLDGRFGTQNGIEAVKKIRIDEDIDLNKHIITWQILCCIKKVELSTGTVVIEMLQNNQALKMNIPCIYNFKNIPPCVTKHYVNHTESLIFVRKS